MKIIDTHVHIWDLEKAEYSWLKNDASILNRTWNIDEIADDRKKAGITAGVLIQASGNLEDTNLMLNTADKTDWICGVIGWLPLMDVKQRNGTRRKILKRNILKVFVIRCMMKKIPNGYCNQQCSKV
jgi:L-fuconolactonase